MFVFQGFLFFSYFADEAISISSSFFRFYMDKI
jgi:hypothetical protein